MKIFNNILRGGVILILFLLISCNNEIVKNKSSRKIDLTNATILLSSDIDDDFRKTLLQILDEEIIGRSSIKWKNKDT